MAFSAQRLPLPFNDQEGLLRVQDRAAPTAGKKCQHCRRRKPGWFCNFSPQISVEYDSIGTSILLPAGSILFAEGQVSRLVATICEGRVKLTKSSQDGRTLLLKIAKAGDVLGLTAALRYAPYEVTAQAIEPSHIMTFPHSDFRHFLERHAEGSLHAAESLSKEYMSALNEASRLALAPTITGRVAHLLLELAKEDDVLSTLPPEIHMPLKHEDLASMLGSSRESVTRALNELKRREIISIRGTKIILLRSDALELLL